MGCVPLLADLLIGHEPVRLAGFGPQGRPCAGVASGRLKPALLGSFRERLDPGGRATVVMETVLPSTRRKATTARVVCLRGATRFTVATTLPGRIPAPSVLRRGARFRPQTTSSRFGSGVRPCGKKIGGPDRSQDQGHKAVG